MAGRKADWQCRLGMRMARIMEGDILDQTVAVLMRDIVRTSGNPMDRAVDDEITRYAAASGREDLDLVREAGLTGLYVALTRTTSELVLVHAEPLPTALASAAVIHA